MGISPERERIVIMEYITCRVLNSIHIGTSLVQVQPIMKNALLYQIYIEKK
jgi:hypothetical protein